MRPIRAGFSGSGFKFPAHVGAALAIRDAGYEIIEYAGTSGGSIVATLLAWGMPLDVMKKLALTNDWSDMLTFSPWALLTSMGYCSGNSLEKWVDDTTRGAKFSDLACELTVVSSDVSNQVPYIFSNKLTPDAPLHLAVRASASIPFAYSPVYYGGGVLMDGGLCNNIPVDMLTKDTVPCVGIQLVAKQKPMAPGVYTVADIVPRVISMMLASNENTHVDLGKLQGATIAFVETGYVSGLDRNMPTKIRQRLMDDGYAATAAALSKITAP